MFQHVFSLLRFGKAGPIIRRNGTTVVEIRNAANDDYETLRADSPTGNDDVATKGYTDTAIDTDVAAALADLASTSNGEGASLIGIEDSGALITGTTVEAALAENRAAIDTAEAAIDVTEADLVTTRPGVPMQNRLRLLGAPGAAVEGNTVTIDTDVYEFRSDSPPSGGTAGRIWVYNGADSAASRTNLIDAINGVVDADRITRDGINTEDVVASAGVTTGDIVIQSADDIGGNPIPSATALACSETLATATDIWDAANMYSGLAQQARQGMAVAVTLNAAQIAKGDVQVYFDFTPRSCVVVNRMRPQDEAYEITGDAVSLTLAGGGAPNNQANDIIDVIAFA